MNRSIIDQQLASLENQIEQEELAKVSIKQQKRAAINSEYDERVARYKQQIINNNALAPKRKLATAIPKQQDTRGESLKTRFTRLIDLDLERIAVEDQQLEMVRRQIDAL